MVSGRVTGVINDFDYIPLMMNDEYRTFHPPMKNKISVVVLFLALILTFSVNPAPAQESSEGSRKVVTKVVPQYPSLARSMHIQGSVRTDVLVAANGKVKSVEVKGGHPLLGQAAQDAVRQWMWEPAAHETHESIELRFNP
jgi:TonB family protein